MSKRDRSPIALSRASEGEVGITEGFDDQLVSPSSNTLARPTKRHRSTSKASDFSLEGSLSEEILLRCISYLPIDDLITISRVSSAWHRLAQDAQLWRSLYLSTFASHPTSRSLASASLASLVRTRPWRELYKISSNWRRGNARSGTIGRTMRKSILAEAPEDLSIAGEVTTPGPLQTSAEPSPSRPTETTDTILQFHQQYFFTATRTLSPGSTPPPVTVHQTLPSGESLLVGTVTSSALLTYFTARPSFRPQLGITELRLDERAGDRDRASSLCLAVFYSTGQFSLFRLHLPSTSSPFSFDEVYSYLALSTIGPLSSTFDPVALARFHSPLLATCSRSFVLRFWRIEERNGETTVEEIEPSLKSRESWAPVVLTLKKVDGGASEEERDEWGMRKAGGEFNVTEEEFKVTLAYSTPIFPDGWSVGVQEFSVRIPSSSPLSFTHHDKFCRRRPTITTRHAIAPSTSQHIPTLSRRQQQLVTSIEHSDPFIVTSRSDNTLDVFEVVSQPSTFPPSHSHAFNSLHLRNDELADRLRIVHRRTLFGHTARVASVAIEEGGRCVSGGDDGMVKVWQLGERSSKAVDVVEEETEVGPAPRKSVWTDLKAKRTKMAKGSSGSMVVEQTSQPQRIKRVWFDESKIVTIVEGREGAGESVKLLRFD